MKHVALACTLLTLAAALPSAAASYDGSAPFEAAAEVRRVKLGPAATKPISYKEIRCFYFEGLTVKEIDEREIGDKQISYLIRASGQPRPPCTGDTVAGERNLPSTESYFWGVVANALFLIDADGANGSIGFSVYDRQSGRRRFQDTTKLGTKIRHASAEGDTLRLGYTRVITGACSIIMNGDACWKSIAQQIGISDVSPPDCRNGYEDALHRLAAAACTAQSGNKPLCIKKEMQSRRSGWDASPSMVSYNVDVLLAPNDEAAIKPIGRPISCWPSD